MTRHMEWRREQILLRARMRNERVLGYMAAILIGLPLLIAVGGAVWRVAMWIVLS